MVMEMTAVTVSLCLKNFLLNDFHLFLHIADLRRLNNRNNLIFRYMVEKCALFNCLKIRKSQCGYIDFQFYYFQFR